MSNRRRTTEEKVARKARQWTCPKCGSTDKLTKEYPAEAMLLHICARCEFPERVALDA